MERCGATHKHSKDTVLEQCQDEYSVGYASATDNGFVVHKIDGYMLFCTLRRSIVDAIKNIYALRQYSNARKAHFLQNMIGKLKTSLDKLTETYYQTDQSQIRNNEN